MDVLWSQWLIFADNPTLSLKKQSYHYPFEKFIEFSHKNNQRGPPSFQTFYESILDGIQIRQEKNLYRGNWLKKEFISIIPNFRAVSKNS